MTGRIRKLFDNYGFIRGDDTEDYFLLPGHVERSNGLKFADLKIGDTMEFIPIEHPKGKRAIDIRRALPGKRRMTDGVR